MRAKSVVSVVAAVALLGLGLAVAQAAPQENRPFDAVVEGTSTAPIMPGAPVVPFSSSGTIRGTHIGEGTYTISGNQDYGRYMGEEEHPMGDCAFVEDGGAGLQITAANGDTINGNIDNDRSVVCVSETQMGIDTQFLSTLYINVTGGTGRFANATGWLFSRGTSTFREIAGPNAVFDDVGVVLGDIDY